MVNARTTKINSSKFTEQLFASSDFVKQAADTFSLFIQDKVREKGFARQVIKPTPVSQSDLILTEYTDQPAIMVDRDVDARAMTVPIRGRGEHRYIETARYPVYFEKIVSEKIKKSKMEMMTQRTDYKKLFEERIAEAMFEIEDMTIVNAANKIIVDLEDKETPTTIGNLELYSQSIIFKNGETLDKSNIVKLFQLPANKRSKIATILMTEYLKQELMHMTMQEVGDSVVSEYWKKGVDNINDFWGKNIVTTIKNHIVKNNEIFMFAPSELYGHFFILRDHTSYIEVDRDMITMDSDAYIAHAVGNTAGVYKGVFEDIPTNH